MRVFSGAFLLGACIGPRLWLNHIQRRPSVRVASAAQVSCSAGNRGVCTAWSHPAMTIGVTRNPGGCQCRHCALCALTLLEVGCLSWLCCGYGCSLLVSPSGSCDLVLQQSLGKNRASWLSFSVMMCLAGPHGCPAYTPVARFCCPVASQAYVLWSAVLASCTSVLATWVAIRIW